MSPSPCCGKDKKASGADESPLAWFANMVSHCLDYAAAQKKLGRHIVGVTCEFTPRELIIAAGGIPVCLCGGSKEMIPAAEEFLPANLCPLVKSTFGYSVRQENPFLEMVDLVIGCPEKNASCQRLNSGIYSRFCMAGLSI